MPEINAPIGRNMVEGQPQGLPNKTVVDQAYGAGSHVSVEVLGAYGRGGNRWSALAMILLLVATSLAQAVLASAIRRQGIRVESFPTAGNPAIGFLALGVAACFVILSVLDKKDDGKPCVKGVKILATAYSSITLGVMTVWSFGERAVYLELNSYEQCMTAIGDADTNRGKCICWDDDKSDGTSVDLASNSDISCGGALEYVGDILGSYVLMVTILVLTAASLWYKPFRSKPITTDIVLEANPTPYVVSRTNPATQWGKKYQTGQ